MYALGAVIGNRYKVRQAFPQSGQGEAYLVYDRNQHQLAVLKLLDVTKLSPGWAWDEAILLTHLSGDFILPVLNADLAAGVPYVVTKYAQNGTLDSVTPSTGLPPARAVRHVREACGGTTRTLDAGLLHRDIKPDNIFLNERGQAQLGDFGLAYRRDASGAAPPAGTLTTLAPEVAAANSCTVASEVYSLGATLYFALAGRFPHDPSAHPTVAAWVDAIINTQPDRIRDVAPHVSIGLGLIVDQALAYDPDDRYEAPQQLDAALGGLRKAPVDWLRTDEHTGHFSCWRGRHRKREEVHVCALPAPGPRVPKYAVEVRRVKSGVLMKSACRKPVPAAALPQQLRSAMSAVER